MKLRTIDGLDLRGKYVLLRDDFNVQIVDGQITDAFRIEQSMPTINKLRAAGARVAIVAHRGRPKGTRNMEYTLQPIADYMGVQLIPDCLDKDFLGQMRDGDLVLLENVRFYAGEEQNDPVFAAELARGFDVFVNDAFAVSHRAHASTVGVAEYLPAYAGDLLASEIEHLSAVMENPKRPLLSIVAGSKVSTKIGVLKALAKLSDTLIIGGALGTTFNYAQGGKVGNSLFEADQKDTALEILEYAAANDCRVLLPLDKGVAKVFERDAVRENKDFTEIEEDDVIIDAGEQTTERDTAAIRDAATVIWNGTVGMAEWMPTWSYGSFALARTIAEQTRAGKLESIVGGGDTVAALEACGVKGDITYVSTGGGAFLEFIEGRTLPAIVILEEK
ncbi:MAG: phosphoglycerate kinase [Alphaproteobacteria bacterium]|nr:phosphoglycerate kinase [Alphaproteobacteria bacterium]MBQ8367616.1 phosphoglycerate kinase [Alphaproteobacteria bacterium]